MIVQHSIGLSRSSRAKLVDDRLNLLVLQLMEDGGENVPGSNKLIITDKQIVVASHTIQDQAFISIREAL
jgi:hypothetical protein